MKKFLWSLAAALSTPEAIKAETTLAVIVLTRVAILVPSAASIIALVVQAIS